VRNVGPYEERKKEGNKQQEGRAKTIGRRNERTLRKLRRKKRQRTAQTQVDKRRGR
jgi:hypothetical protein